ncbi:hypothetical protein NECID01_1018 [Nematocida sp. AWRm77]|nr:hypothetical protein NECID01_1018 [Nematocida sp. AWRm77]
MHSAVSASSPLVQYIVLRNDLNEQSTSARPKYSQGALITQAVHAGTLALFEHQDETVLEYTAQGTGMTTVVLQCTKTELEELHAYFTLHGVKHSLWTEHPENEQTALGMYPLHKTHFAVRERLRKLKLWG